MSIKWHPSAHMLTRQATSFRRQTLELQRHVEDQYATIQELDHIWRVTFKEASHYLDHQRTLLRANIAFFPRHYYLFKYQVWMAMESLEESEKCFKEGERKLKAGVLAYFLRSRKYALQAKQPLESKLKTLAQKVKKRRKTSVNPFYSL